MALISYYKLNGNINDELGNSDGVLTGGRYVSGIDGEGVNLDGQSDIITLPASSVNSTTGSLAISFWAKLLTQGTSNYFFHKEISSSTSYNINIHFPWYSNDNIYWDIGNNTASYNRINQVIDTKYIGDGKFHHWVFQLNSDTDTQQIYLDGVLWHSGTGKTLPFVNSSKDFHIGKSSRSNIDEIKIYDVALTQGEIIVLYNEYSSGLDFKLCTDIYQQFTDMGDKKHEILNYGAESGDGKVSKYSAYFNGDTGKFIQVNLDNIPSSDNDFSWGGWFMKNRDSVSSYPIFISFGLPYIACNGSGSPFRLSYNDGGQLNLQGTSIPSLNTWYHVFVVREGSTLKIYIDGVEENSVSIINNCIFSGFEFEIGRHNNTDTYRIWGRVDDVRFYNKALNQEEIDVLVDPTLDTTKMSFKNNGDIIVQGMEEEVDWTLWNNWVCPSLDSSTTQFDSSIGSRTLSSIASMQSDGWTTYLNAIDSGSYTKIKGISQQYYGGGATGYIQKALPSGYDMVRVKWGNWYTGTSRLKVNGSTVQDLVPSETGEYYTASYSGTPLIRLEESGIYWISEIWVGKSKTPLSIVKNSTQQPPALIHNGLSPNLHLYSTWTVGTGSVGDFNQNGSSAENNRKYGGDPWGNDTIVWNCYPDATSGADGGWAHAAVSIDNTKLYRYSVWVRRNNTNNGRFYHGCNGYGTTAGVYGRGAGALNTNPYFYNSITGLPVNEWMLVVGHIWPAGSGTGAEHPNSGIYRVKGYYTAITDDYVWHATSTTGRGRTYLYYTTITAQRQRFVYPMFEVCDGTETPIEDLINGSAYNNMGLTPDSTINNIEGMQSITVDNKLLIQGKVILK